jgi:hypothetical protein
MSISSPLQALSSAELDAIYAAARPLARDKRDAFMNAVMQALAGCAEIGPGSVNRVIRSVQPIYFDPPLDGHHLQSKYDRHEHR